MRRQALLLAAVLCSLALLANATAVEVKATSAAGVEASVALEQRVRSELDSLEAALVELDAELEDDEDEADEIPFNDTENDGDDSEDESESEGSDGDDQREQEEQEEGAEDDSEEEGEGSDDGASKKEKTDKSKSKNKRSKRRSKRSKKNKVAAPVVPAKPLADGAKKGYQLPAIIANFTVPTVSGSACPKGSYQVFASTSNSTVNGVTTTKQNITVTFTSFSIRSGLGIATARNTHDCSFSALVHKPVGLCNFASSGSYEGTIYLRDQAQLELKRSRTTTNDLGKKQSANSYKAFKGPKDLGTPFKPHFPKVKMASAMSEGDLKLEHTLDATLSPSKAAGLVKFTKLSVEFVMECRHK